MYKYDVYYDGYWLCEDGNFETEEEAMEEAKSYIEAKIADWKADGVEWENLFEVEIEEV